jgi:hypothetical protein
MNPYETQALQLCVALLPSEAVTDALPDSAMRLAQGDSPAAVADALFVSEPARAVYPAGAGAEALVRAFYAHALGREPDAEGLSYWRDRLAGASSPGGVLAELVWVAANYDGTHPDGLKSAAFFAQRVRDAQDRLGAPV